MPPRLKASSPATAPQEEGSSSAIAKGVAVLEGVLAADAPIQLADLAKTVGAPKTSVHRLLLQLEEAGLLRRDLTGKAWLQAPRLVALAARTLTRAARMDPVHAALRRLVDAVGESVNLAILDRGEVVYADRVECNWPLRTSFQPGSRVPVHCTASGKLFLAWMAPEDRARLLGTGKLVAYTGRTLTDPEALEAELRRIRARGVAVNDQEFMVGLVGVAVPVEAPDGALVAALALHAPVARMTAKEAEGQVPLLRRTAREIATALFP